VSPEALGNPFTSWPQRVIVSLLVIVAVAIGAHMTDALLTPLVLLPYLGLSGSQPTAVRLPCGVHPLTGLSGYRQTAVKHLQKLLPRAKVQPRSPTPTA
jgi:hypothetical protein